MCVIHHEKKHQELYSSFAARLLQTHYPYFQYSQIGQVSDHHLKKRVCLYEAQSFSLSNSHAPKI